MKLWILFFFVNLSSVIGGGFFDDLPSSDAGPSDDIEIAEDGLGFHSKLLELAQDSFHRGPSLFNYDQIHGDMIPDVGVYIGSKSVNRWSSRFLQMADLPIRNIEYKFEEGELGVNITIDLNYFVSREEIDFLAPTLRPGEIFTKYRKDRAIRAEKNNRSKKEDSYFLEMGLKLRFPLLGNQELNTVHLGFRRTYFKTYYKSDYNEYLKKQNSLMYLIGAQSGSNTPINLAKKTLEDLMKKLDSGQELNQKDQEQYTKASAILDASSDPTNSDRQRDKLEEEIASFESGSILPFKLSPILIKDVIDYLNKNKILSDYLDVEILDYQESSAGIVKVSGLNRLIETVLPGLSIYFVGTRNDSYTGKDKIFIAGKLYE